MISLTRKTKLYGTNQQASEVIGTALFQGRSSLFENEAEQILRQYRIPTALGDLATNLNDALIIAKKIGFPLAMKVVSPDILHKSDSGGVSLGISSFSGVEHTYRELVRNAKRSNHEIGIVGIYLQRMAPSSFEFVVGGLRDPQFGSAVMFGLGGIYVELFRDVSFRLAPVSDGEALAMMKELKSAPLLSGFRGREPLDVEAASRVIVATGQIMNDLEKIESLDINPLFIYKKGCLAVDVRVMLKTDLAKVQNCR